MQCWTDPLPPSIHPIADSSPRSLFYRFISSSLAPFTPNLDRGCAAAAAAQAALFMRELIRSDVLHPI